jgi:tRNA dimethylallyltransferase
LPTLRAAGIPFAKVALRADPATLASRIEERTATMLHTGLIEEAERIGTAAVAANAVGYREALAYTNGWLTFEELRQVLARATRQYAKRQRTWFRTEPNVIWIEAGDMHSVAQIVARLGWHGRGP